MSPPHPHPPFQKQFAWDPFARDSEGEQPAVSPACHREEAARGLTGTHLESLTSEVTEASPGGSSGKFHHRAF